MRFFLFIITTVAMSLLTYSYGQNQFYIGTKSYPSTKHFSLYSNVEGGRESNIPYSISALIAKIENGGIIALTYEKASPISLRIEGHVLIYLDDGTVIKCLDRGKYDIVNNSSTTVYYLTENEISKLKNSNIKTIRYSLRYIGNIIHDSSSSEGNFMVSNETTKYWDYGVRGLGEGKVRERINVPNLIAELFNLEPSTSKKTEILD